MVMVGGGTHTPEVRPLAASDAGRVRLLHEGLDVHDARMRWFGPKPKDLGPLADQLCQRGDLRCALGAFVNDELVGVGYYTVLEGVSPRTVELALVVARDERLHGVGTLLLDRLEDEASRHGVRRMIAEVMVSNGPMLQVIRDRGWGPSLSREGSTVHLEVGVRGAE